MSAKRLPLDYDAICERFKRETVEGIAIDLGVCPGTIRNVLWRARVYVRVQTCASCRARSPLRRVGDGRGPMHICASCTAAWVCGCGLRGWRGRGSFAARRCEACDRAHYRSEARRRAGVNVWRRPLGPPRDLMTLPPKPKAPKPYGPPAPRGPRPGTRKTYGPPKRLMATVWTRRAETRRMRAAARARANSLAIAT